MFPGVLEHRHAIDVSREVWLRYKYTSSGLLSQQKGSGRWSRSSSYPSAGSILLQLEAIGYLVKHGADVNARNDKGETPLHIASGGSVYSIMSAEERYWTLRATKLLLKLGAKTDVSDNEERSCLNKASNSPRIMQELLKWGADISTGSESVMFSAIKNYDARTLRILLDNGVDVNAVVEDHVLNYTLDKRGLKNTPCFALHEMDT